MKVVGKVLAAIVKYGKQILSGGVKVAKKAAPAFKATAQWLKAHPKVTSYLAKSALATATTNVIVGIAKKAGLSDEEAKQFEAILDTLNPFIDLELGGLLEWKNPFKGNHPQWWFNSTFKLSAYDEVNTGLGSIEYYKKFLTRSLYLCFNYTKDRNFWLPDSLKKIIHQTYKSYYARLFVGAPNTEDQVASDICEILYSSFIAVSQMFALRRYQDSKLCDVDGNEAIMAPFRGVSPYAAQYRESSNAYVGLNYPVSGFRVEVDADDNNTDATLAWVDPIETTLSSVDRGYNMTLSNKAWTELISKIKNLSLSDAAYDFAKYLFGQYFVDTMSDAEIRETYVFFPPTNPSSVNTVEGTDYETIGIFDGNGTFAAKYNNVMDTINAAIERVNEIRNRDKAYPTILGMIGLMNQSYKLGTDTQITPPKWYSTVSEDLKRDQLSKTYHFAQCDESMYNALYNAVYKCSRGGTFSPFQLLQPADLVEIYPDIEQERDVLIGKVPEFKVGPMSQSLIPIPGELNAGEVAGAVKFRSVFNLYLGPTTVLMNSSTSKVMAPVMVSPAMELANPSFTPLISYPEVNINVTNALVVNATRGNSIVPGQMSPTWWYYDNREGGSDDIAEIKYKPVGNINEYSVKDLDTVLDYQWPNLFLGIDSLRDLQKQLNKIELYWAINS